MRWLVPAAVALAVGCSGPADDADPAAEGMVLPDAILGSSFAPLDDGYGYDPTAAAAIYGRSYAFVNLDPAGFADGDDGDAARRALARLLTHTTSDITLPMWARLSVSDTVGPPETQLARLGFLPSPYALQNDITVRLPTVGGGEVEVAHRASLAESMYLYEEDGAGERAYVSPNCLVCHGGVYGDQVVAGAPNKDVHLWNLQRQLLQHPQLRALEILFGNDDGVRSLVQSRFRTWLEERGLEPADIDVADAEIGIMQATSDYMRLVASRVYNEATLTAVGAQSSTFVVYTSMAMLKPGGPTMDSWDGASERDTSALFDEMMRLTTEDRGSEVFPVHGGRAWWQARYSGAHFTQRWGPSGADGSNELLAMALGTPNYGNHHQPAWADRVDVSWDLQRYMEQIASPPFPEPIDWEQATEGLALYNGVCAECHGTLTLVEGEALGPEARLRLDYDMSPEGSWVDLDEVGVDRSYNELLQALEPMRANLVANAEYQATGGIVEEPSGPGSRYVEAPPLIGVWATAPFLHNSSVPSVYLMLNSPERPDRWRLDSDPHAYDTEHVGVVWQAVDEAEVPSGSKSGWSEADWRVVDTTDDTQGRGHEGHTYGDAFSDEQRYAVIELLKALGTHNVEPNPTNSPFE